MATSWRGYYAQQNPPYLGFAPLIIGGIALSGEVLAEIGLTAASLAPFIAKYAKPLVVKSIEYATPLATKTKSLWMAMSPIAQMGSVAAASAATWAAIHWAASDEDYKQAGKAFAQVLSKYWQGDDLARLTAESAPFTRAWMVYVAQHGVPANPTSDKNFLAELSRASGLGYNDTSLLIYAMVEAHSQGLIGEQVWNGTSKTATADMAATQQQNETLAKKLDWQTTALIGVGILAAAMVLSKK